MIFPVLPHPERIVGGQQYSYLLLFAQPKQIVPHLHYRRHESTSWTLQKSVLTLAVLQHQANAIDAMSPQPAQMAENTVDIPAAKQRIEVVPGNRIIMPDRRPTLPCFGHKVRRVIRDLDPWHL